MSKSKNSFPSNTIRLFSLINSQGIVPYVSRYGTKWKTEHWSTISTEISIKLYGHLVFLSLTCTDGNFALRCATAEFLYVYKAACLTEKNNSLQEILKWQMFSQINFPCNILNCWPWTLEGVVYKEQVVGKLKLSKWYICQKLAYHQ